jgi:hypothetical protein
MDHIYWNFDDAQFPIDYIDFISNQSSVNYTRYLLWAVSESSLDQYSQFYWRRFQRNQLTFNLYCKI